MGAGSGKGSRERRKLKERARRKAEKASRYAASRHKNGEKLVVVKTGNGEITKRGSHARRNRGDSRQQAENRVAVAAENQKERVKRSNAQQIEYLDFRLGTGLGAKKERARLTCNQGRTYGF